MTQSSSAKVEVAAASGIMVTCQATGYPSPNITWLKNNQTLPDSHVTVSNDHVTQSSGQVVATSTLTITRAQLSDAGVYVCQASNHLVVLSRVWSTPSHLTVLCELQ